MSAVSIMSIFSKIYAMSVIYFIISKVSKNKVA